MMQYQETDDVREAVRRLRPYYDGEEIAVWLCSPHPQLGGDLPAAVLNSGDAKDVFTIIDRLDADGYI